jgi:hypothetical protein
MERSGRPAGLELEDGETLVREAASRGERIAELEDHATLLALELPNRRRIVATGGSHTPSYLSDAAEQLIGTGKQGRRIDGASETLGVEDGACGVIMPA